MKTKKSLLVLSAGFIFIVVTIISVYLLFVESSIGESTTKAVEKINIEKLEPMSSSVLIILFLVLLITTLVSISISFYLYKWRKILLTNKDMIVPEEWAKYLSKVGDSVKSLGVSSNNAILQISKVSHENTKKIDVMIQTFMELQAALDEKDKEISRLKVGYDSVVFKKYLSRFIRIDQTVHEFLEDSPENTELTLLQRLFEDAFDECNVSKFAPNVGDDYRKAFGVSDTPKKVKVDLEEQDFKIAEILEDGYQLGSGDKKTVIKPAKVKIFVTKH